MTRIGVVGASARAAVHSLVRAGFEAWAVDQFADRDLARVAECLVCPSDHYPDALPELAARFPPGPILYTGALENYPHIVAELARSRELWGNLPNVLARVRDPFALAAGGIVTPRLIPHGAPCPAEGRWLRKPFRSGAGLGIRFASPNEAPSAHHYFQEFVSDVPMSAVFANDTLLGVTEQLIGEPWLHASGFAYCGNIGPVEPSAYPILPELGLREVWGVDFVCSGGRAVLLEVNPRYTAAIEALEHAQRIAAYGGNVKMGRVATWQLLQKSHEFSSFRVGKAIYFAPRAFHFPERGPWDADLAGAFDPWRLPGFADIPEPAAAIETGHPVLTFFATGSTPAEVRERLQSRAAELDRLFTG